MKAIASWKDCRDPGKVRPVFQAKGGQCRPAAGDHEVWTAPNGQHFTIYNRELSTGVACKLFKWLKFVGLLVIAGLYLAWQFA